MVHNDIKPDNVFLFGERARVADFGEAGKIGSPILEGKGTSAYLPPAVCARLITTNDPQTDVYATGVMLLMTLGEQLGYDLARINEEFREFCLHEKDKGKRMERYELVVKEIQDIQRQISVLPEKPLRSREFWQWAATLIDPLKRPTSAEALERFDSYLAHLRIV